MLLIKAKFTVTSVTETGYNNGLEAHKAMCYRDNKETDVPYRIIRLSPVCGAKGEDIHFSEATPNGSIELHINNPDLKDEFQVGQNYSLTFERVKVTNAI